MELSYFLAQLMGLSLTIFAVIGIIRPQIVSQAINKFDDNPLLSLLFGFMGIVVGLAVILSHNIWEANWRGVVTLFGWVSLFKGVIYLLAPNMLLNFGTIVYKNSSNIRIILVVAVLLGIYLARKGFGY